MTGRSFVDSNIIVYAHDKDAGEKQKIAKAKLEELWMEEHPPFISIQVLEETSAVLLKKGMSSSKKAHVKYILSEDLSHNREYEGIKIINPFL